jgi:hypothetical protein
MSISAHCGSCNREVLLGQLVQPSNDFRCPVCGFAFAPGYATVAPGVAARVMAAQAALVTELAELDRATVVDPVANTLPRAEEPGLGRRRRAHWWGRDAGPQSTQPSRTAESSS